VPVTSQQQTAAHARAGSVVTRTPVESVPVKPSHRKLVGMMVCVIVGHQVAWGPCPRCEHRARG
jgi:hypothetical protein